MKSIEQILSEKTIEVIQSLYQTKAEPSQIVFQPTNKDFEGDLTLVVFPFLKASKKTPELTAQDIGQALQANCSEIKSFNVIKGFLNLVINDTNWAAFFKTIFSNNEYGLTPLSSTSKTVMLEYCGPNTNKPLHLGHVRNCVLGYSVSEILKANGNKLVKANIVNDRGVHICKSMLAWQKWGNGETPASSGIKGDHLVGKYYVEFDKHYKAEIKTLVAGGMKAEDAEKKAPLMLEVQTMLQQWEAGDKQVVELWSMMNGWVYDGFEKTYKTLGVDFDKTYYESQTYLLGKKLIDEELKKPTSVFLKKDDGSVWIDLTAEGLDQKLVLRSDGTSVYITQDIATAIERYKHFPELYQLIYTVANEQNYHFKVLFLILEKLGYSWAKNCYHLAYGMVELPEGKMKSREGTVVDADDLVEEMINTARETTKELGKIDDFSHDEAEQLYRILALGALKYFILKVDPKKKMIFDPKESIDFNGNTGPFIQYTHARIRSVIRKAGAFELNSLPEVLDAKEKNLIALLYSFPDVVANAGKDYSPAHIANYIYELAKGYNQFYHELTILKEENVNTKNFRIALSQKTADVIRSAMKMLGIEVPERM